MCCSCTGGKICEHCRAESCRCWQNPPATFPTGKDNLCFTDRVSECFSSLFQVWETLFIPSNPSHLLSRLNNLTCSVLFMRSGNCPCYCFFGFFNLSLFEYMFIQMRSCKVGGEGGTLFSVCQITFIEWCNGATCYFSNP